jgi:hypothetical protein
MSESFEQGVGLSALVAGDKIPWARSETDRRTVTWRTVLYGFFRSRRRAPRRANEVEPLFTDYHHPWLFFLATGIMLMSCVDAFFTLQLLDRGAIEINPVMALVIGKSATTFAVTKLLLTSIAIFTLVFVARAMFMQRIRAGLFLTFFFSVYAILVCYEFVYLLSHF